MLNIEKNIHAVIVTYNPDLNVFARQLNSLLNEVDSIVVVDNNSKNLTGIYNTIAEANSKDILKIEVIKSVNNVGLGRAQNIGIKYAKNLRATHVLLLDQDSILDKGFVKKLSLAEDSLLTEKIKIAAVGPIYYNELTSEVYPITKYIGPFIKRILPDDHPVEATFLIASGCLISIDIFDSVGYMNEDLFIDYIDVDWSFKAKDKGYKLYACPSAKMSHTIGDNRKTIMGRSISVHSPLRRYYLYRNSIFMLRNPTIDFGYKVREVTFNILRLIIFLTLADEKSKYFKYSYRGFVDGFKGVKGICPHQY